MNTIIYLSLNGTQTPVTMFELWVLAATLVLGTGVLLVSLSLLEGRPGSHHGWTGLMLSVPLVVLPLWVGTHLVMIG